MVLSLRLLKLLTEKSLRQVGHMNLALLGRLSTNFGICPIVSSPSGCIWLTMICITQRVQNRCSELHTIMGHNITSKQMLQFRFAFILASSRALNSFSMRALTRSSMRCVRIAISWSERVLCLRFGARFGACYTIIVYH